MNNTNVLYVCPHCEKKYVLGKEGTVEGCDVCLKVVRNQLDGTIIEDTMTDMEKA